MGGWGGGERGVIGGSPRFPYFDVFQYVNCGERYDIRSTREPRFYKGVFNPVIPIQIFAQSRSPVIPMVIFGIPHPVHSFNPEVRSHLLSAFWIRQFRIPIKASRDPQHRSPGSSHEQFDVCPRRYLEADIRQRGRECFLSISEYWAITNFSNVATYT